MAEFITESAKLFPINLDQPLLIQLQGMSLMAKAFGGDNYFVSNYDEMKMFFARAVDSGRPNIINVQIATIDGEKNLAILEI